jgi:NAD(P) transhydrogenase
MNENSYDLLVIGSGPAGQNGALTAARFGKRVAMIEKAPYVGGASANTGTLPSKTLRETALAISGLNARDLYGVDLSIRREATVADFMYHETHVKQNARERISRSITESGIELIRGAARFLDAHTLAVTPTNADDPSPAADPSEIIVHGKIILIATGSSPVHPSGFEFADQRVYDSDEILQLNRLPRSLAVIGAGVIGSEYACTFAALGAKVTVIDGRTELLPFLDRDLSEALERSMRESLGITFLWGEKVTSCRVPDSPDLPVQLTLDSGRHLEADATLVAAGRESNTPFLNLPAAGIAPGPKGLIPVDCYYRTAVPNIYAAGDVIGFPALAATSKEQARIAVSHAFREGSKLAMATLLPTGIYTIPEVSMVGACEQELQEKKVDYIVGRALYRESTRGEIIGDRNGYLKLIFDPDEMKLLGVHAIGEQATELVHIGMVAMLADATADLFNRACFNYPTLGDLYKDATYDALARRDSSIDPPGSGNTTL